MIYTYKNVPLDTPVWAFAYELSQNPMSRLKYRALPYLAIVKGETPGRWDNRCVSKENPKTKTFNAETRLYAETQAEAKMEYNHRVTQHLFELETQYNELRKRISNNYSRRI